MLCERSFVLGIGGTAEPFPTERSEGGNGALMRGIPESPAPSGRGATPVRKKCLSEIRKVLGVPPVRNVCADISCCNAVANIVIYKPIC